MNFNLTDEELKKMSEDEFFAYLDSKAQYLAKHTKKLSPSHIKKYASLSSAISKTEFDYDATKKIIKETCKSL